ncbi:MAG: 30S ribosomal protein S8 [Candidatus Levybacteria bacterium]|nr:30S ribosomal protein S8 [Candidatus Levybacteria bacterium]
MNHTVSDFIIRIKNAALARRKDTMVSFANINKDIAKVLIKEGFLEEIKEKTMGNKKVFQVKIKYKNRIPVLTDVELVSKPSLRVYNAKKNILDAQKKGMYTMILSTSQGIMTGHEAFKKGIGGEVLFKIW